MFFVIEFLLNIVSYQFFKNYWIFINHGFLFGENISIIFVSFKCLHKTEFESESLQSQNHLNVQTKI